MNKQITITGSPADLAEFLNNLPEDVQVNLSIEPEGLSDPEGGDADGAEEADG
ncbi:hypothetical protein HMPREF9623_01728 [Stomatobaculum longum]|uniref:Uncharacterized protein n=1 Tax=Stomatobaculum longum TaxID=796942 RepID=A0AA36Y3L0_9FIRM|nr:hypothetical protein [Stomatobaculum longum]EHO15817.1 hypothetical protein HMPREF9623_01728 [Stomatobaculum longum]